MIRRIRLWLMIGISIFVLLLAVSIPKYKSIVLKSKETALKDNLFEMRRVIKQYIKDKQRSNAATKFTDLALGGCSHDAPLAEHHLSLDVPRSPRLAGLLGTEVVENGAA